MDSFMEQPQTSGHATPAPHIPTSQDNSLSDWNSLEVNDSQIDRILTFMGDLLDSQIRHLSRSKRDQIMISMRERLQVDLEGNLGHKGNSHSTLCEKFQMSVEELLEYIPMASSHSQMVVRLGARLGCDFDDVELVIEGKLKIVTELENRLEVLRSEVKLEALRSAKREEALLARIKRHQDLGDSLPPGPSQAEPMFMETPTGPDVRRRDESWRAVREQYRSLKKLSVEDNLRDAPRCHAKGAEWRECRQRMSRCSSNTSLRSSPPTSTIGTECCQCTQLHREKFPRDFLRALEVKFPPTVWQDADRRDILINHLEGTAKAVYRSLPRSVREGSFKDLVGALELARKNPCDRLKNIREWDTLSKRSDESVVEFCCRMEDLSRRIHPSCEWDFIRGSKLYSCLESWQDSYHMLAALDAPEGKVYEAVKKVARRLEKLQEDVATHTNDFHDRTSKLSDYHKKARYEGGRPSTRNKCFESTDKGAVRCFSCGEVGHIASKCGRTMSGTVDRFQQESGSGERSDQRGSNAVGGITPADDIEGCRRSTNGSLERFQQGNERGGEGQPGGNAVGGITLADDVDGWCMTVRLTPPSLDPPAEAMGELCICSANARKRSRLRCKPGCHRNETRTVNVRTNAVWKDNVSMFDQSPQGSSCN
ncbi:unnamed protein product [Cylicocyclus nassatus]|uniref:CCHC-type domain-containing protein n=1 Tax=Cylicocyclus nassatus TaxID=53992 RepID=A0AA36DP16_CYLNA|nr:unnamed protein product [Cylicocyclus nassatus]